MTPFAQILASLRSVRNNYICLTSIPINRWAAISVFSLHLSLRCVLDGRRSRIRIRRRSILPRRLLLMTSFGLYSHSLRLVYFARSWLWQDILLDHMEPDLELCYSFVRRLLFHICFFFGSIVEFRGHFIGLKRPRWKKKIEFLVFLVIQSPFQCHHCQRINLNRFMKLLFLWMKNGNIDLAIDFSNSFIYKKTKQTGMVIHDWSVFIDGDDGRPVSFHFYFLFVCLRCKIDGNRNEAGRGDLRKPPPARRRRNRRICRTEVSYRKVRKLSNHYLLLFFWF